MTNTRWTKVKNLKIGTKIAIRQDSALAWDEIVSIKSVGRERVYDIEVENSHNFVGNDILAHNTYIFGNVGIGTTTPTHKLEVAGDIAATGFVNLSTREAKKDISFLADGDYENILGEIASTSVATYYYNDENPDPACGSQTSTATWLETEFLSSGNSVSKCPSKRLGLIAEEAPVEVLSADHKGVDLYKMVSFSWAGIKELALRLESQQKEIEEIKLSVEDLKSQIQTLGVQNMQTSDVKTSSTSDVGIISQGFAWVMEQFRQIGISIASGVIQAKEFIAEKITARTAALDNIEMKDAVSGDIYCVRMENGELTKTKGKCLEIASPNGDSISAGSESSQAPPSVSDSQAPAPEPAPEPAPAPEAPAPATEPPAEPAASPTSDVGAPLTSDVSPAPAPAPEPAP